MTIYVGLGFNFNVSFLKQWETLSASRKLGALDFGFLILHFFYAFGTHSFSWYGLGKFLAFLLIPTIALLFSLKSHKWQILWDLIFIMSIWLPFDLRLLDGLWTWPDQQGNYIFATLFALNFTLIAVIYIRNLDGINYNLRTLWVSLHQSLMPFALFLIPALPFGFATDFITFNPQIKLATLAIPFSVFFFIALPEELLFRGLIQNRLTQAVGKRTALIVTSIVFGATHLNNPPLNDWRYFTLATIAGFFYGATYHRYKSIVPAALVHTLVDSVWVTFLTIPK